VSNSKQTFENDSFDVQAQIEPGCKAHLQVRVKPPQAKKCFKQAIKKINKQISIPGFRKGKAPDEAVLKKYTTYVDQEWKEILLHEALQGGFDLSNILPLKKESLEKPKMEKCSHEEGALFSFSYECYPQVPEVSFDSLELPSIAEEPVSQEKIDEVLLQLKKNFADFEPLEDKEIAMGDYVELTIDNLDQDPPSTLAKERRFPVEEGVMAQWMIDLVLGKKKGDIVEGKSAPDDTMTDEEKKNFVGTNVRFTIHGVYKILLAEINDELAKKVGCENEVQLMERIQENLQHQAKDAQKEKQLEALEEKLLDAYSFDLPQSILHNEEESRLRREIQRLKLKKLSDEEIKNEQKGLEKEVAEQSERSLRLYFLNKQIAKQGNLSLSQQEINQEIIRYLTQNPQLQEHLDKERSQELYAQLTTSLMTKKTKEYALSQVLAKASV
jgi:trigger factor